MFCRSCGKAMAEGVVVCVSCGLPLSKGAEFCQACGAETNPAAAVCVKCGAVLEDAKSKLVAGLLGILLGGLGVHRFYLGYTGIGIAQIAVSIVTCGVGVIWGLIEGILILTGKFDKDAQGRPLKE